MYVCGVSSGLSWLATNVKGSAGGVRRAVAAGIGVSVEMGVAEGWSAARAVSRAWVNTALMSGVGVDMEGAHAARAMLNRLMLKKK